MTLDRSTFERCPHDKEHPFTMVSTALIRDNSISPECRWLIIYLLANRDGWKISIKQVINHLKGQMGRDKVYVIVSEAIEAGYVYREKVKKGNLEYYKYTVSETPKFKKCFRYPDFPDTEIPDPENTDVLSSINGKVTSKEEYKETPIVPKGDPSILASPSRKRHKKREELISRADRVSTTPSQHESLLKKAEGSLDLVQKWYNRLSEWYISKEIYGGSGDYRSILNWIIDAVKNAQPTKADQKQSKEQMDKQLAETVYQKFCIEKRVPNIAVGYNYVEFQYGPMNLVHLKFGDAGFKEQVLNNLRKMNLPLGAVA